MKNFITALLCAFLFINFSYGQSQLNDYKYILIPKKLDGLKTENQYKTSTYLKHLLKQNKLNLFYSDDINQIKDFNPCEALTANLINNSNMFRTKTAIVFTDCKNQVIFKTLEGKSKLKEFDTAYREAIKKATASLKDYTYKYSAKQKVMEVINKLDNSTKVTISYTDDVKKVEPSQQTNTKAVTTLYAQPKDNGYQLVDQEPKVICYIYPTSNKQLFTAKVGKLAGVLMQEDQKIWRLEYHKDGKLIVEKYQIKF